MILIGQHFQVQGAPRSPSEAGAIPTPTNVSLKLKREGMYS
jgi:hypothetical protein